MEKQFVQVTLKNAVHIQIEVESFQEYQLIKKKIQQKRFGYVQLAESCDVKPKEVVLIEFMTYFKEEGTKGEN